MEIREVLKNLREKNHLTQDQMAERVMVTRQAVSRWETGETQPNTDTLKLLSKEFDVSINTLLGSPRQLVCQCCGMPLPEDSMLSREPDGSFNEDYCMWWTFCCRTCRTRTTRRRENAGCSLTDICLS